MKLLLLLLSVFVLNEALDNGLGKTPQMGWNSWNHYGCNVNETVIMETIDAIVEHGFKDVGYTYVNVDDCWASYRDAYGKIHSDPVTFPHGMKYLADYAHSRGLLFGLYSDAGKATCAGRPGSLGYEELDAESYAEWGVDYLKYDNCFPDGTSPEVRYPPMRDALNETGRPIFFSMCEWGVDQPALWAYDVGNSWRTSEDIRDTWASMISRAEINDKYWQYAMPGGWNDPDMLEVGNGGMTVTEYKTHFSLWALLKSPMIIGCDVTSLTYGDTYYSILTNTEVIAVNQDPLGVQGHFIKSLTLGLGELWAGPLSDYSYVVILLNVGPTEDYLTVHWGDDLSIDSACFVRDLWEHKDLGVYSKSYASLVPSHGVVMLKVTPVANYEA